MFCTERKLGVFAVLPKRSLSSSLCISPDVSSHLFTSLLSGVLCCVVSCCFVLCRVECQQHFLLFVDPVLPKTRERGGNHHIKRERGGQSHHHRKERAVVLPFFFWRFLPLCWSLVHTLFVETEGNHVAAVFRVSASHVNQLLTIPNVNTIDRKKSLTLTNSTYFT